MNTELSFLVELLLNHKLQKSTKDLIANRIKEVEFQMRNAVPTTAVQYRPNDMGSYKPHPNSLLGQQSPSTQAALARHPDLISQMEKSQHVLPQNPTEEPSNPPPLQNPTVIAHTPAAMEAMNKRNEMIAKAQAGKGGGIDSAFKPKPKPAPR